MYFVVHDGKMDEFKAFCKQACELAKTEDGCIAYGGKGKESDEI